MKKLKKALIPIIALVVVIGTSVTALAATGQLGWNKVGDQYAVDYVTAETTVDGILVQTIERKWIPEDRFNPDDPRNPRPTQDSTSAQQRLRQAGIDSRNDLQTSAWSYQWSTTPVEASATDTELKTNITFQVDESVSADRWVCTFVQVVRFDSAGNPYVKYYIGNQEYSVASIKRMFAKYGRAR